MFKYISVILIFKNEIGKIEVLREGEFDTHTYKHTHTQTHTQRERERERERVMHDYSLGGKRVTSSRSQVLGYGIRVCI